MPLNEIYQAIQSGLNWLNPYGQFIVACFELRVTMPYWSIALMFLLARYVRLSNKPTK